MSSALGKEMTPEPIAFDWKEGTASIVWESPTVGLVRFHDPNDTSEYPDYRGVCIVKVTGDKAEFKGMKCDPGPTKEEHVAIKTYLKSKGLSLFSRRTRDGKVVTKKY